VFDDARGLSLRLLAEAPGWIKAVRAIDQAPAEVKLELVRGVVVTGRVTSVRGRWPVDGATVTLSADGAHAVALTDDTGTYTLRDIPPGWAEISVSHPEHADGTLRVEIRPTGRNERPFEVEPIDLVQGGAVEGIVVRPDGTPVMGARVGIGAIPAYLPVGALPAGMTNTDQRGGFKLPGIRPGRITVGAYAAGIGHGEAHDVEVVAERTTSDVRVVLDQKSSDEEPPMTASVAITLGERAGAVFISQVAVGSEAERGGLRPGDVVVAIDGRPPSSPADARQRLNGPHNSDVLVEVRRGEENTKLRIAREAVRQ
jgi:membrane-associated protease RseP (regulator of RpoE activity)